MHLVIEVVRIGQRLVRDDRVTTHVALVSRAFGAERIFMSEENFKIVHLSMYGQNINIVQEELRKEENVLIVVGAEKVPREIYELADYNVGVGSQPHSEISALAIFLDRIQEGKQFEKDFIDAKRKIIPTKNGKNVQVKETRD